VKRSRPSLIFKAGQPRTLLPDDVREVIVAFGASPMQTLLFEKFGAWKAVLKGTIVEPAAFAGKTIVATFALPENGQLGSGSRLYRAALAVHGPIEEGKVLDFRTVFANTKCRAEIRKITKDHRGKEIPAAMHYCVLEDIKERVK